ncbi:MAG: hypothetical protein ACTSWW_07980 [Promethearchaeota archaeon]
MVETPTHHLKQPQLSTGFVNAARMRFTSRRAGTDLQIFTNSNPPPVTKLVYLPVETMSPLQGASA